MTALKELFKDKRRLEAYVKWVVRILLLIGITYLSLIKDTSQKTVFVQTDPKEQRVIVLDHIITEANKNDSIIQIRYYEIPTYDHATADSLYRYISGGLKGQPRVLYNRASGKDSTAP